MISTGDVFAPASGVSAKPIVIIPFEELRRTTTSRVKNWLLGVFGKEEQTDSLITPTDVEAEETGVVNYLSQSRREAILVWADWANVDLTDEMLASFFQDIKNIERIGPTAAMVEIAKSPEKPKPKPIYQERTKRGLRTTI